MFGLTLDDVNIVARLHAAGLSVAGMQWLKLTRDAVRNRTVEQLRGMAEELRRTKRAQNHPEWFHDE